MGKARSPIEQIKQIRHIEGTTGYENIAGPVPNMDDKSLSTS
jgi:hypothetical protein